MEQTRILITPILTPMISITSVNVSSFRCSLYHERNIDVSVTVLTPYLAKARARKEKNLLSSQDDEDEAEVLEVKRSMSSSCQHSKLIIGRFDRPTLA